jgi:hypothetical protein
LVKIKFNYILDHPELLPKFLPLIAQTISPISIEVEYYLETNKMRTKWKSADQQLFNFNLDGKEKKQFTQLLENTSKRVLHTNPQPIHIRYILNTINILIANPTWSKSNLFYSIHTIWWLSYFARKVFLKKGQQTPY